jgi:hypothetical protein
MLDVFFISMDEEGSEDNWNRLLEFVPNAKRVKNVQGIYQVHETCAKLSATENFWVVDADAWVVDDFDFKFIPNPKTLYWNIPENECVLVWPSRNPVNELVYGYGGVKLFPRKPFLEKRTWELDLSTTIGRASVAMPGISCETRFNVTPESAWIGAFRECAKLASLSMIKSRVAKAKRREQEELEELAKHVAEQEWDDDKKANYRKAQGMLIKEKYLNEVDIFTYWAEVEKCSERRFAWCTHGWFAENGKYVINGAIAGSAFGLKNSDDIELLNQINNWTWLKKEFKNVNV